MSACLQEAMNKVDLGVDHGRGVHNLFMVNEAEAAAMYTLTSAFLQPKVSKSMYNTFCRS